MLSLKQQRFCEYYVELGNATEAAKRAGYSEKTARSQGQRMLTFVDIQKYLNELTANAKDKRIASADEVIEFFTGVMRDKEEATKNRLKAAENLAKRYGMDKPHEQSDNEGVGQPVFEFVFKDMTMKEDETKS